MEYEYFNFNGSTSDGRYFVLFPDAEEKQAFADTFVGSALNHMRLPYVDATGDGLLFALILARSELIEGWKEKHPRIQFVEAKHLTASWGDDY